MHSQQRNRSDTQHSGIRPSGIIISDVLLYREGLANGLSSLNDIEIVGSYDSLSGLEHVERLTPSVIIVDVTHPDTLKNVKAISKKNDTSRFVGFGIGGQSDALSCAEAGISAFVGKDETIEDLNEAALKAIRGEAVCSPKMVARLVQHLAALTGNANPQTDNCLTRREREVAALVKDGLSNKEIANLLGISPATVKNHVHMILEKLNLHRRGAIGKYLTEQLA